MENKESTNESLEETEFDRFLEKYEVYRIRDNFKERIITIVIASLGLIAALAWAEALKHLFEKLFGGEGGLKQETIYAIVITVIAAIFSVYLGKLYKKEDK